MGRLGRRILNSRGWLKIHSRRPYSQSSHNFNDTAVEGATSKRSSSSYIPSQPLIALQHPSMPLVVAKFRPIPMESQKRNGSSPFKVEVVRVTIPPNVKNRPLKLGRTHPGNTIHVSIANRSAHSRAPSCPKISSQSLQETDTTGTTGIKHIRKPVPVLSLGP